MCHLCKIRLFFCVNCPRCEHDPASLLAEHRSHSIVSSQFGNLKYPAKNSRENHFLITGSHGEFARMEIRAPDSPPLTGIHYQCEGVLTSSSSECIRPNFFSL
jgi:hypothetical protein